MMPLAGAGVADGIVFSGTLDGRFVAYDTETGDELWRYQAGSGFNAPMAITDDMVVIAAAGPLLQPTDEDATPAGDADRPQSAVIAFRLGAEGQATPAASPEATPAQANVVQVELTEFEIRMPNELPAGATTFEVTNVGSIEHNFEVEGQGIEREFEQNLQPGETKTLEVDLQPGTYEVYCPVGNHAERGMRLELTVND